MAKIKKRGESGAAKNYITRTQALKKLQISLSDFRRLCILKGIYPREPTNKKKANKGSSAPASFYYSKDIMYLLHEPLLNTFRQHKTFAKKLARALGRGEWSLAKGLEERKPEARLDHLIKERYPTFKAAMMEMNDPLSLLSLFERLPRDPVPGRTQVPVEVTAECGRLINEWKVWAIRTHALRKVFLSIKGIYYECEVPSGQSGSTVPVRWLEPYEFTQHVPSDVDFRILLTFLDLYRTLTSFALYKLYTEENLVYPPPMDVKLDQSGEGVGKFQLVEREDEKDVEAEQARTVDGKRITKKDVKKSIKSVQKAAGAMDIDEDLEDVARTENDIEVEEFVHQPSKNEDGTDTASAPLPTYTSLMVHSNAESVTPSFQIFSPYTFYLSRETSSRTWEFIIRAFGGKVVTHLEATSDASNPNSLAGPEGDKITHVIIDRPMGKGKMRDLQGDRKWAWVQPQWVADCANRREVLPSGEGSGYEPGGSLPPHLSPWDGEGEIDRPWLRDNEEEVKAAAGEEDVEMDAVEDEEEDEEVEVETKEAALPPALLAAALNPTDDTLLHQAELEAEAAGVETGAFKKQFDKAVKDNAGKATVVAAQKTAAKDEDMRKIMMTGKKQRLYEKMTYSNNEKKAEQDKLEEKRQIIEKRKKKEAKAKLAKKAAA